MSLTWTMNDGCVISLREMTDVHLANTITRLEIQAERESYDDDTIAHLSAREAATAIFPVYVHLIAERARRIAIDSACGRAMNRALN